MQLVSCWWTAYCLFCSTNVKTSLCMRKVHNPPDMGLGIKTYHKYDITTNINESVHLIVNDPSSAVASIC